jgi:hypothetical protein
MPEAVNTDPGSSAPPAQSCKIVGRPIGMTFESRPDFREGHAERRTDTQADMLRGPFGMKRERGSEGKFHAKSLHPGGK